MTDVVDLIKWQHRHMDALLEQAAKAEPEQVVALLQEVADLLLPHSKAEESFVYPAIREYDGDEAEEVQDGAAEHHHVESLMKELLTEAPSGPGYDGKLAAMIGELRHHVEEEEQELLPVLSEKASEDERAELGARFAEVTGHLLGDDAERGEPTAGRGTPTAGRGEPTAGRGTPTRDELYEQARKKGIPGRSGMTKDELAAALGAEH